MIEISGIPVPFFQYLNENENCWNKYASMFKIFVLCPIFLNQKAASFSVIFLWFEASVLTSNFISSLESSDAVLEMDSIVQRLCPLCQEVTDEPLKCPGNSKDVKQISQTYINRKTLLKQFQTAGTVPRNFHYALQAFLFFVYHSGRSIQ